jgi:hypothetical protein
MKNIHVLPTDKPSVLIKDFNNKLLLTNGDIQFLRDGYQFHNIYITSNEEIKEREKCITFGSDKCKGQLDTFQSNVMYSRKPYKIILTTDQDLIKDGVQAIEDEFLEWFVKNPSCEYVEVIKEPLIIKGEADYFNYDNGTKLNTNVGKYKIIIPQEELTYTESAKKEERIFNSTMIKQETLNLDKLESQLDNALAKETKESLSNWLNSKRNNMKETLEEFISNSNTPDGLDQFSYDKGLEVGAKWQAENMPIHVLDVENTYVHIEDGVIIVEKNDKSKKTYSEEEILKILQYFFSYKETFISQYIDKKDMETPEEWFEQFKKK